MSDYSWFGHIDDICLGTVVTAILWGGDRYRSNRNIQEPELLRSGSEAIR